MRRRWLAAVLGLAAVACGGVDPVEDPRGQAAVKGQFDAWVRAWNSARAENLAPFYIHKDHLTVGWPNGERTHGWTEESQFQSNFLSTVMLNNLVPRDPTIVLVRRDLAVVSFGFSLDQLAGGRRQIGPGQGLMLWQREEGAWRIYAAQLSYTSATQREMTEPP